MYVYTYIQPTNADIEEILEISHSFSFCWVFYAAHLLLTNTKINCFDSHAPLAPLQIN